MQNKLSYINSEGYTVFTGQFLKNKGTCCQSACLHCPYGYTLKKHGLEFVAVTEENAAVIENILIESGNAHLEWKSYLPDNIQLMKLKGVICGFMLKNHIVVKQVYLLPHFHDQNLSKELIESYFFI